MHAEWGHVSPQAVAEIEQTRAAGGRIIPVGTTALRLIETAARGGTLRPFEGETDIFIYPGFEFQITEWVDDQFPPAEIDPADAGGRSDWQATFGCGLCPCGGSELSFF